LFKNCGRASREALKDAVAALAWASRGQHMKLMQLFRRESLKVYNKDGEYLLRAGLKTVIMTPESWPAAIVTLL